MGEKNKSSVVAAAVVSTRLAHGASLGIKKFPQREIAKLAGVSTKTWVNYEKGSYVPKQDKLMKLAAAGVNVAPLQAAIDALPPSGGEGLRYSDPQAPTPLQTGDDEPLPTGALPAERHLQLVPRSPIAFSYDERDIHLKYEVVPRYSVRASAGRGIGSGEDELAGQFAFEVSWMQKNLGRAGSGFASVAVHGDSMQPTLLNGDEIIIDRQVVRVDVSGIYVISLRGDLLVKRVQRKLDGSLVVKSDNPAYEPETITAQNAEDFRVVGRMVWPRVR